MHHKGQWRLGRRSEKVSSVNRAMSGRIQHYPLTSHSIVGPKYLRKLRCEDDKCVASMGELEERVVVAGADERVPTWPVWLWAEPNRKT